MKLADLNKLCQIRAQVNVCELMLINTLLMFDVKDDLDVFKVCPVSVLTLFTYLDLTKLFSALFQYYCNRSSSSSLFKHYAIGLLRSLATVTHAARV